MLIWIFRTKLNIVYKVLSLRLQFSFEPKVKLEGLTGCTWCCCKKKQKNTAKTRAMIGSIAKIVRLFHGFFHSYVAYVSFIYFLFLFLILQFLCCLSCCCCCCLRTRRKLAAYWAAPKESASAGVANTRLCVAVDCVSTLCVLSQSRHRAAEGKGSRREPGRPGQKAAAS